MTDIQQRPFTRSEQLHLAALYIDGLATEGQVVSVDPDIAEFMASFDEAALDEAEAIASALDDDLGPGIELFTQEVGVGQ